MSARGPSKFVFVGNIPWDVTEEVMAELFREPGPLVSFRLVVDKDTLKPRGYGFAEYFDLETAKSAVRNLNEIEVSGRKLRVNFADNNEMPQPEADDGKVSTIFVVVDCGVFFSFFFYI
jgi:cleavage stimulation factor subunit 2